MISGSIKNTKVKENLQELINCRRLSSNINVEWIKLHYVRENDAQIRKEKICLKTKISVRPSLITETL